MVRRILGVSALAVLVAACGGCYDSPAEVSRQSFDRPNMATVSVGNVTYCTPNGQPQVMDIYKAAAKYARPRPAIIGIHGGAWLGGDKRKSDVLNYEISRLQGKGYDVFMINYRVGVNSFPYFMEDAKCAVRHVRANAEFYGIIPDGIGVMGHSAGAHMAAFLAVMPDSLYATAEYGNVSSRPNAVVTFAAPLDLTADTGELRDSTKAYIARVFGDRASEGSPTNYVTSDDVPVFAVHGTLDESISYVQSEKFVALLQSAGVDATFLKVINGGHSITVPSKCKLASSDCYGAVLSPTRLQIHNAAASFFKRTLL